MSLCLWANGHRSWYNGEVLESSFHLFCNGLGHTFSRPYIFFGAGRRVCVYNFRISFSFKNAFSFSFPTSSSIALSWHFSCQKLNVSPLPVINDITLAAANSLLQSPTWQWPDSLLGRHLGSYAAELGWFLLFPDISLLFWVLLSLSK